MTNLSPQAQAVLDAAYEEIDYIPQLHVRWGVAAALRAAAYQVAPARPQLDSCCEHWEQRIRHKLLAIVAELEGVTSQ